MDNMMKCPDCGHEISKKAATCPNCGRTINGSGLEAVAGKGGSVLGVIIVIVIAFALIAWLGSSIMSCVGMFSH